MKNKMAALAMALILCGLMAGACSDKSGKGEKPGEGVASSGQAGKTETSEKPEAPNPAKDWGDIESYAYTIDMSVPGGRESRIEYKVAGDKMSMKLFDRAGGNWRLMSQTLSDGHDSYVVEPATRTVVKMLPEQGGLLGKMPGEALLVPEWNTFLSEHEGAGVEKKGKKTIDGEQMTEYFLSEKSGRPGITLFIDNENLIRRMEVYQGSDKPISVMNIRDIKINPKFSDAEFQPPKGYKVQDLTNMPGMGKVPAIMGADE